MFTNDVLPLLRDVAGMRVDVHVTTGPGHVQIMRDLNLADVSPCVCVCVCVCCCVCVFLRAHTPAVLHHYVMAV